jgi:hypothetical protein
MEQKDKVSGAVEPADVKALTKALAMPFEKDEVKWKPQVISGNRAMVVCFVDARVIQDRLDDVVGSENWQDAYECLPDGAVVCRLRIRLGSEWITKVDVGGQSEQPDEGDRRKAAFSDALKRAAVKFGIGRYLYRLEPQWVDYDPKKKKLLQTPELPPWALPAGPVRKAEGSKKADKPTVRLAAPAEQAPVKPEVAAPAAAPVRESRRSRGMPANGPELQRRLYDHDERLAREGVSRPGELVKHVVEAGVRAGHERDLATWSGPAIQLAVEETRTFEARLRQSAKGAKKEVA